MDKQKKYIIIINDYKGLIIKVCRIYTNTNEDFEDLYQNVLINIWTSLSSFKGKSKLSTWLYRIALNVAMTYKTKQNKKYLFLKKYVIVKFTEDFSKEIEKNELNRDLYRCISELNSIDKSLVILWLDEVSYKDISEILGISENYVSVKFKRVKKKLLTCIKSKKYE